MYIALTDHNQESARITQANNTSPMYAPSAAEFVANEWVKSRYEMSKRYWTSVHEKQRRLYARYCNDKLLERDQGYSNIQIAKPYYIVDIIASYIIGALLRSYPYAKISAIGDEDFTGKQIIDRVHGWQDQSDHVLHPTESAIRSSCITGTGCLMPGWRYHNHEFMEKVPQQVFTADPNNPFGEMIPQDTGQYQFFESVLKYDHLAFTEIMSWNVFMPPGVNSDVNTWHNIIFRMKFAKHELMEMQKANFLRNVEYIDNTAFNAHIEDLDTDSSAILSARYEYTNRLEDKDSIWLLFYYGKFPLMHQNLRHYELEDDVPRSDEIETFIVKPENADVILRLGRNPFQSRRKPCIMFPYEGLMTEANGRSPLWVAEKLFQHDENMFNMTQDAANREIYKRTYVPTSVDQSPLKQRFVDQIVEVPDELFREGAWPKQDPPNQYIMPAMHDQSRKTESLIYEITGAIDMLRGLSTTEQSATKTGINWKALNMRFKHRLEFMENRGLKQQKYWQTALNHQFLDDETVAMLTGIAPSENPFRNILPMIPLISHDYKFEGSKKAVENPIKAQLIRGILDILPLIPPGIDEQGRHIAPNTMVFLRELIKNLDFSDDIEKFFTVISENEFNMRQQATLMGGAPGRHYQSGGELGALTSGDMSAGVQKPTGGASDLKVRGLT